MAYSPALAHRQRVLASLAADQAGAAAAGPSAPPMPETGPVAGEYAQLLIALGDDLRRLQDVQSIERKIEAKRALIQRYLPWVDGAIAAGEEAETAPQDEIVARMLLWTMDVGDWPRTLAIAGHVLRHGLALPQGFTRKPAAAIAEEAAEAGLKKPAQIDGETLQQVAALTADADMHDQIRAKLEKAIALSFAARAEAFDAEAESAQAGGKAALVSSALEHFRRALGLDQNSGVKKQIERFEAEQRKLAPAAPAQDDAK